MSEKRGNLLGYVLFVYRKKIVYLNENDWQEFSQKWIFLNRIPLEKIYFCEMPSEKNPNKNGSPMTKTSCETGTRSDSWRFIRRQQQN